MTQIPTLTTALFKIHEFSTSSDCRGRVVAGLTIVGVLSVRRMDRNDHRGPALHLLTTSCGGRLARNLLRARGRLSGSHDYRGPTDPSGAGPRRPLQLILLVFI
jgi:hypothetical protein